MGEALCGFLCGILIVIVLLFVSPLIVTSEQYQYAVDKCETNGGISMMYIGGNKTCVCSNGVKVDMDNIHTNKDNE